MTIADNSHFSYQNEDDLVDFIASEMQKGGLDLKRIRPKQRRES